MRSEICKFCGTGHYAHKNLGCKAESRILREQLAKSQAENEGLREEIGQWVEAYAPDIVRYPSKEEVRAVNETPEFRVGRNAMMQIIHEGLKAILGGKEA